MVVGDNFIFIHNIRSGGHTVRAFLYSIFGKSLKFYPNIPSGHWHKPVRALYIDDYYGGKIEEFKNITTENKTVFGTVRNPWAWYVSIYLFGRKDYFFSKFRNRKNEFSVFLKNLLSCEYNRQYAMELFLYPGDAHSGKSVPECKYLTNNNFGLYTSRFIQLFCKNSFEILKGQFKFNSDTFDQLVSVKIIKLESLHNSILKLFNEIGIEVSKVQADILKGNLSATGSSLDYTKFYDEDLINLVYKKDKVIIDRYNYSFK